MKTNQTKSVTSSHTIPVDMIIDTARILLAGSINWKVESVNENENSFLIQVTTDVHSTRHQKAIENLQMILEDYSYFLKGSPGQDIKDYK